MRVYVPAFAAALAVASSSAQAATITGTNYGGANLSPANGDVLSGTFTNVGAFTIPAGYTVYVADGVALSISATTVTISGTLSGDSRGSNGGPGGIGSLRNGTAGSGSGAGNYGTWGNCVHPAGGGGGGYGGAGGQGGVGIPWSVPGVGGSSYGSSSDMTERNAGSGGGGGASTCDGYNGGAGGDGGGNLYIYASTSITVTGTVTNDGGNGVTGGGGGGGGSGGSILLDSPSVDLSGASLTAEGGNAGNGYWGYAGGGGGGGGGRIKVQYGCFSGSYTTDVTGGTGGTNAYNDTYYGYIASVAGSAGTTYTVNTYGGSATYYADADGDGYGNPAVTTSGCTAPAGYVANDDDCDDTNRAINPAAAEACNGIDDDCDGSIDDGMVATNWYEDVDSDGYGDASSVVADCVSPTGYVNNDDDCDDTDNGVYPGAIEVCDDIDQDCDGRIDDSAVDGTTWYRDADSDAYGNASVTSVACDAPVGYVANATDCNDAAAAINPGATEICNSIDDDCDGRVDDSPSDASTWYADSDADSYGNASVTTTGCSAPAGYVSDSRDCDDSDNTAYPGASEYCDGVDDDCDGTVDDNAVDSVRYYADSDADRYGNASASQLACAVPSGYVTNATDCDDASATVYPGATELCNGIDDDCDAIVDDGATGTVAYYTDGDGDTYGDPSASSMDCIQPSGSVTDATDCDDADAGVNPGATEIPYDGIDQDCSGDDASDLDGDGYVSTLAGGSDCDDNHASTNPGAAEAADGVDEDCDGVVDDGTDWYDDDGDGYTEDGGDCDDTDDAVDPAEVETADGVDEDCDGVVDEGTDAFDDDGDGYREDDGDCNDGDVAQSPGNAEVDANGIDDDCDGVVDTGADDSDGDGYTADGGDCLPTNGGAHPGAEEVADGVDNDCDGLVDEGTDGYDNDGDGTSALDGDCDDTDAGVSPDTAEATDGVDNDCDGVVDEDTELYDDDGDGFTEEGGDCDDADGAVNPAAEEIVNGIDDNCDGVLDPAADADTDGYTAELDCDDANGWANPGAAEMCDGVDNNCDGAVDEGCDVAGTGDTAGLKQEEGCGCSTGGPGGPLGIVMGLAAMAVLRRRGGGSQGAPPGRASSPLPPGEGAPQGRVRGHPAIRAILALFPLLAACNQDYAVEKETKQLVVSPPLSDLGAFALGETGEVAITLTAVTGSQIQIVAADLLNLSGQGFTGPAEELPTLDRDDVATLTFQYEALAEGWDQARLTIQTDEEEENIHIVDLRARAASGLVSVWPSVLDFGPVAVGADGTVTAELTNTGSVDVDLLGASADAPFTVLTATPVTLATGSSVSVDLGFTAVDTSAVDGEASFVLSAGAAVDSVLLRANDCLNGSADLYDADRDGYARCASDCDDSVASVNPAASEDCDGVDQDCNGLVDDGTPCFDDDGDGLSEDDGDCNDADVAINPSATENLTNGRDDDCDGVVDLGTVDLDADGVSTEGGDCDDADDGVWPGAPESADGVDNDCDGTVDEGTTAYDDDGDGVTEAAGDCDDGDRTVKPSATELADWIDNDCDGTVDEGTVQYDDDGDGYTENGGDCDDSSATTNPGEYDAAGGADADCDGTA